jgi:hypothetical protein
MAARNVHLVFGLTAVTVEQLELGMYHNLVWR